MRSILVAIFALMPLTIGTYGCSNTSKTEPKPWSVRMVESEMVRAPHPTQLDFMEGKLKWNYTTGLELNAFADVSDHYQGRYNSQQIWDYVVSYADTIINAQGEIYGYKMERYNIDHVCPGRVLFRIYDRTGNPKYRTTLTTLREQLSQQPRTADGGFWHKEIYPHQMWLDGLYMGAPFYGEYALRFESGLEQQASFEDVAAQFDIVAKHTYDPATKLYRHAWDESRTMFWADPATGQSEHAWGRALGWYVMGIVEALDLLPQQTVGRERMVEILRGIYEELPRYADPQTGMWYQVLDQPGREGNYVEATASAMFVYAMLKGVRKGYLDAELSVEAINKYAKFIKTFIREDADGTISLTRCCSVAGLGGKGMRSGTFDYYISEPIVDNDPKGVGPFIWASLEMEMINNKIDNHDE